MITEQTKERAIRFSALHKQDQFFIIPNVWNAGSARIFEKQGFKALATTSAGIAYSLGYPDGEQISLNDVILVVQQISSRCSLPLSVDFERGYGNSPKEVKQSALRLLEAGAVGFNLEDGLPDGSLEKLDQYLAKLDALVQLREETEIPFVINARTCAYWLNIGKAEEKQQVVLERGKAFAEHAADCVFIPGAISKEEIALFLKEINAPLNIIANPLYHDFEEMQEMGVRRLSIGSGAVRSTYNHLLNLASELKANKIGSMLNHQFSYAAANAFFGEE